MRLENYKISFIHDFHLPVQWQAVEMRETYCVIGVRNCYEKKNLK